MPEYPDDNGVIWRTRRTRDEANRLLREDPGTYAAAREGWVATFKRCVFLWKNSRK